MALLENDQHGQVVVEDEVILRAGEVRLALVEIRHPPANFIHTLTNHSQGPGSNAWHSMSQH